MDGDSSILAMFCRKTKLEDKNGTRRYHFRTDTDVRGSILDEFSAENSKLKNVQGCTFFSN